MMSSTQLVSGCSLGTQWDSTNEHGRRTKPKDEKEKLNFYGEEASSQPKVPMPTGDKNTEKKILEILENQCKRRILKRALEKPKHIISVSRCGGSAARRFHVFARRFRVFRRGSALSRNSSTNQGRMGQNSIKTTRIDLKLCR
jgi:hypothetical protein